MTRAVPYVHSGKAVFVSWTIGAIIAVVGLWLWLGSPPLSWYEMFLVRPNVWMLVFIGGGFFFGFPIYAVLTLRGRLRQLS